MRDPKEINDPAALFEHCKRYTDKKKTYSEGNRNNYIFLLACNCNKRGLTEDQCLYYSCEAFDLATEEIKQTISSAYKNVSEHNTDNGKKTTEKMLNIDEIEEFLNEKYHLRYNVVIGKLEYKLHLEEAYKPMTDYVENSIFRELMKAGIKIHLAKLRSILCSDFCPVFDPFLNYFNSLPQWDGETDYIAQLSQTVKTTQPAQWELCFNKWIVAMVGCVVDPKVINHTAIVFTGKQGVGKTTWMESLVPNQLKDHLFSGTIKPNDKDALILLSECMLINLDELESLNRSEIGYLKELITKTFIKMRRVYGRNNERMNRNASFCGSVNNLQFLNDATGSRRFLCFEVLAIEYLHTIDINLVLAQALYLFKNGFQFWFNQDEIKAINSNNEQYQLKTAEEELLLTWFEKPKDKYNISYLSTSEIATKLSIAAKLPVTNSVINLLGKALHKHEYFRCKRKSRWVYAVVEKNYTDVEELSKEADLKD